MTVQGAIVQLSWNRKRTFFSKDCVTVFIVICLLHWLVHSWCYLYKLAAIQLLVNQLTAVKFPHFIGCIIEVINEVIILLEPIIDCNLGNLSLLFLRILILRICNYDRILLRWIILKLKWTTNWWRLLMILICDQIYLRFTLNILFRSFGILNWIDFTFRYIITYSEQVLIALLTNTYRLIWMNWLLYSYRFLTLTIVLICHAVRNL